MPWNSIIVNSDLLNKINPFSTYYNIWPKLRRKKKADFHPSRFLKFFYFFLKKKTKYLQYNSFKVTLKIEFLSSEWLNSKKLCKSLTRLVFNEYKFQADFSSFVISKIHFYVAYDSWYTNKSNLVFQFYLSLQTWHSTQASSTWRKRNTGFEDHNPVTLQFMVRLATYTDSFRWIFQSVFTVWCLTRLHSSCSEQD